MTGLLKLGDQFVNSHKNDPQRKFNKKLRRMKPKCNMNEVS